MPITIIIGAQWGDEGKGRVVDWLSADAEVVARYAGGDNAGHTVAVGETVYKLHLIPSGILRDNAVSVMGNGMVINPVNLIKEMDELRNQRVEITPDRLKISSRAHIITPAHIELDKAKEQALGDEAIGTTLRGIGPAYLDKTDRQGIRIGEMLDEEGFADQVHRRIEKVNKKLESPAYKALDPQEQVTAYLEAAKKLRPYIQDTTAFLHQQLEAGARVICEGAQGTLLDVDHGSYPFVTSSSPSAGGAITGLGIGPMYVDRIVGVAKAFSTRVGGGPMPTELYDEIADRLRGDGSKFWDEFGTTTGRSRRCGWLDGVMLRYATLVNGFSELVITKLDILSSLRELKIAVAYEVDGQRVDLPPVTNRALEKVTPIYDTLPGWDVDIQKCRTFNALPVEAQNYVQRISELCDVPIHTVSVGPERDQLVQR